MLINFRYVGGHDDIHLYMMVDIEDEHYTIFLCYLDQNRNPNINNRDHLVGRPTTRPPGTIGSHRGSSSAKGQSWRSIDRSWNSGEFNVFFADLLAP